MEEFTFSVINHDSDLLVRYGPTKVRIRITEKNLASSADIKAQYIQYLQVANQESQAQNGTLDDFFDWVIGGCDDHLSKLTPRPVPPKPTLHDFYEREICHLALYATASGVFTLKDDHDNLTESHTHHLDLFEKFGSLWPSYEPSDVTICGSSPEEALFQRPREVITHKGGPYFFKRDVTQRELETYAKIKQASLERSRISRLYGLVWRNSETIVGLLLGHIGCESVTLRRALERHTDSQLRQQWIEQLTTTLSELHTAGIVWGDAKADNVLIDGEKNAWIIDFGGGHTRGWVDEKLANTVEGDQQGLSRIVSDILSKRSET